MNYNASYCNFDCKICGEVCPSGAISEITLADKHLIQIGKTRLVKEDCIVVTKKKDCGACSEHCPTKAVRMVPYEGKLKIPEVHNEYCIGCGACDHACPTIPRKAIFVESNHIHQQAKPPEKEKMVKPETVEEFPF
jgi:formate hydrogenlyase subunit 6/NADH:ubiquinone oxidoreductase subunit I